MCGIGISVRDICESAGYVAYDGELGEELPTDELHLAYGELHVDSASGACDGSVRDRCEVTG